MYFLPTSSLQATTRFILYFMYFQLGTIKIHTYRLRYYIANEYT